MRTLYPDIKPYCSHQLSVDAPHQLYIEECGSPDGIPALFVHGGPGAGSNGKSRCFFDPERYRIIVFDQRGAGRSTPHASTENNNTDALISDMEAIREYLKVDAWMLFGGSWGATLSLAYAQAHPRRVLAMVLRGVFLCRERDLNWFYRDGANRVFPDYWQDLVDAVPGSGDGDLISSYYRALNQANEVARMAMAKAWTLWESRCSTLHSHAEINEGQIEHPNALAMAMLETHYFMHNGFLAENQLLDNVAALESIPGIIVHGRYDMVCSLDNAVALHRAWLGSELYIVRDAGHASVELGIVDALITATDAMAARLRPELS